MLYGTCTHVHTYTHIQIETHANTHTHTHMDVRGMLYSTGSPPSSTAVKCGICGVDGEGDGDDGGGGDNVRYLGCCV
jgi:hypothetical protein